MDCPRGTPPVTPLRKARCLRRISMKALAAAMEVHPETVRRWERGYSTPRYPEAVAAYLGCTVDVVLFRGDL